MTYALLAFAAVFLLVAATLLLLFYRDSVTRLLARQLTTRGTALRSGSIGANPAASLQERLGLRRRAESFGAFASSRQSVTPEFEKGTSPIERRLALAG